MCVLVAFWKVGDGRNRNADVEDGLYKMRKRDRKGAICVSGNVEKLLFFAFQVLLLWNSRPERSAYSL
jgi:hypothetical protein